MLGGTARPELSYFRLGQSSVPERGYQFIRAAGIQPAESPRSVAHLVACIVAGMVALQIRDVL